MVLKVCDHNSIQQSCFWLGMNTLFSADFPNSLGNIKMVYLRLTENSLLTIPPFVAAESETFVLAKWLDGDVVSSDKVTDQMVIQLAGQLSQFHQLTQATWGPFHQASIATEQWSERLQLTLELLAENHSITIPDDLMRTAVEQVKSIQIEQFVPIMPDLRWDQFLHKNGRLTALVDLDAFVYGPRELELALLEYLLDERQAIIFAKHYQHVHALPDMSQLRLAYRLLLFLMTVLGEDDIDGWMQAPTRF